MITSLMTNTLIKTINSITTGIGNAIESETGQKVISETKNAVGKAIKPVKDAGIDFIDERKLHSSIKEYSNKRELLVEIYSRTSEEEGIELSNDELKKLISFFDKPENAMFILFRYFLLLFAVRIRGLKYQRDLDETRGLLRCVLYELNKDEAMLNLKYEEIAIASRNVIPQVIDNISLIVNNLEIKKTKQQIAKEIAKKTKQQSKQEEKEKFEREQRKKTPEQIRQDNIGNKMLKFMVIIMAIFVILGILIQA